VAELLPLSKIKVMDRQWRAKTWFVPST